LAVIFFIRLFTTSAFRTPKQRLDPGTFQKHRSTFPIAQNDRATRNLSISGVVIAACLRLK